MMEKYGIFLLNGANQNYGTIPCIGLTKLYIGDFDTLEDAAAYIRANRITLPHFIMQYWVVQ